MKEMKTVAVATVNNVPEYAKEMRFWVVSHNKVDGSFWFYGSWDEEESAKDVAKEIEGYVLMNIKFI